MIVRKLTIKRDGRWFEVVVAAKDRRWEDAIEYLVERSRSTGEGVSDYGPFRLEVRET